MRKIKIKFLQSDANADAEVPMPRFPNGPFFLTIVLKTKENIIPCDKDISNYLKETPRTIFLHIKSKILGLMGEIREKKTSLDIDAMSEDVMKSEASNVDKNLIETIIAELTKQKVIANQKTCHELDPFDKGPTAKQSIDFTIIKSSPSN